MQNTCVVLKIQFEFLSPKLFHKIIQTFVYSTINSLFSKQKKNAFKIKMFLHFQMHTCFSMVLIANLPATRFLILLFFLNSKFALVCIKLCTVEFIYNTYSIWPSNITILMNLGFSFKKTFILHLIAKSKFNS